MELSDILGNFDAGHREVRFQALGPDPNLNPNPEREVRFKALGPEEPGQESLSEPGGEGRG